MRADTRTRETGVYSAGERPHGRPCKDAPWQAAYCRGPTSPSGMMKPLHQSQVSSSCYNHAAATACDLLMISDPPNTNSHQPQPSLLNSSWTACELHVTANAARPSPPSFTQVQLLLHAAATALHIAAQKCPARQQPHLGFSHDQLLHPCCWGPASHLSPPTAFGAGRPLLATAPCSFAPSDSWLRPCPALLASCGCGEVGWAGIQCQIFQVCHVAFSPAHLLRHLEDDTWVLVCFCQQLQVSLWGWPAAQGCMGWCHVKTSIHMVILSPLLGPSIAAQAASVPDRSAKQK